MTRKVAAGNTKAPRVRSILRRHAPQLAALLPAALLEVALDGGLTLSYRYLIDGAIVASNGRVLATVLGALGAGAVVSAVMSVLRDRAYARRVASILSDIRVALFEHVERLSVDALGRRSRGDVVARFTTDLAGLEGALAGAVGGLVLPALGVVVGVALLFVVLSWKMALAATLVWPLVLLAPRLITPAAARAAFEKKEREAELLVSVDETIAAHRTIKMFGLGAFARARFDRALTRTWGATRRATFLSSLVERTTVVTIYAMQIAAVAAGSFLAYRREVTVGSLVSFLTVFWNLGWSIVVIGRSGPNLVAAWGSARRVDDLLAEPTDAADAAGLPDIAPLREEIRFVDVSFAYEAKRPALLFASLAIRAGESVAFVGPSGSGKSTVLALLARLHDPLAGSVRVDGVDVREASAASLRSQMAFVMQESFLFDTTIRENIRIGRPGASDTEVEAAAQEAEIHETIVAMPEGYETSAGPRGERLSGGQRQRVAIARALVRKPSILLLDEASSALDPASEAAINETLARAGRGRTTVSVTHRLAGAVNADRIFVVNDKRIVACGTHAELLGEGGIYAELWTKQSGISVTGDGGRARMSIDRMRAIELFRPLPDAQLAALRSVLASVNAVAGQQVIEEGQVGSLFYVIARGIVRVTKRERDGTDKELARLDDGDQFGELALLRDAPRSATVTCVTDCTFLTLERAQFLELVDSAPGLRAAIEEVAAERSRSMREPNLAATLH